VTCWVEAPCWTMAKIRFDVPFHSFVLLSSGGFVLTMTVSCRTLLLLLTVVCSNAFTLPNRANSRPFRSLSSSSSLAATNSLVVISPPGGVGEVTAVKAAAMGAAVRWFVVGLDKMSEQNVVLAPEALESIAAAGGSVELAGADVESLLLPVDDPASALAAVQAWCGLSDALVCTFDGVEVAVPTKEQEDPVTDWKNAIMLAAKETSAGVTGKKLAILSTTEAMEEVEVESRGIGDFVGSLFGSKGLSVPVSLPAAMAADAASVTLLRHGQLFGLPESSPDFSALIGGPRKQPELCEEYLTRTVRVDPTLSVAGNLMMGKTTRSSRHAVGEAAALLALQKVPTAAGLDICVSSLTGTDPCDLETWQAEFERCEKKISSGQDAQLFAADFGSVPDTERLADWLSNKWATAVLRTYDIAAIRIKGRPVYATRPAPGTVEIIWQELFDMKTVTVGKMVIQVTETGLTATRGAGDATKGYGSISRKPLNGEDVLVRRLAEAVSQAIEKGLATKVRFILRIFSTVSIIIIVISLITISFFHCRP